MSLCVFTVYPQWGADDGRTDIPCHGVTVMSQTDFGKIGPAIKFIGSKRSD